MGDEEKKCYLHEVVDPNETPYDGAVHRICVICGVKLWELANSGLEFDMRGAVVRVELSEP